MYMYIQDCYFVEKSYDIVQGMTYITKIMLSGIVIINTGYFDNTNDKLLLKIKSKGIVKAAPWDDINFRF